MIEDAKGIITAHYITHWGVPSEIHPYQLRGVGEIAVIEFAPRLSRVTWRYATNGMSALLQPREEGIAGVRTELYATTKEKVTWIDDLLLGLAAYPYDYATFLSEGTRSPLGNPSTDLAASTLVCCWGRLGRQIPLPSA